MNDEYSVYVIQGQVDNRLYVGMSHNISQRLDAHNMGRVFSTKGYRPWKIVYSEFIGKRADARHREKFLKSGIGKELLKSTIIPA